jgi:hypothetical protein
MIFSLHHTCGDVKSIIAISPLQASERYAFNEGSLRQEEKEDDGRDNEC